MNDFFRNIFRLANIEAFCWVILLAGAAFIDPNGGGHASYCVFRNMGIEWCPGCGIGRSIAALYHGDIIGSLRMHPLGAAALSFFVYRIIYIFRLSLKYSFNKTGGNDA